jgi:hypothetical protein
MGKEIKTRNILCKEEEEKIRKKLAMKKYREKNKLKLRSLQQLYYKRNGPIPIRTQNQMVMILMLVTMNFQKV